METILLFTILGLFILTLGYIIYNLLKKTERLEKVVDEQNQYITSISELIELSNKKIGESEVVQAFKSDDVLARLLTTNFKLPGVLFFEMSIISFHSISACVASFSPSMKIKVGLACVPAIEG